jgi:hypothetical protein
MYTFKMQNISNLVLALISKLENDASRLLPEISVKKITTTHRTAAILDKNFSKDAWTVHPSIIPFLMNMMATDKKKLHPCAS